MILFFLINFGINFDFENFPAEKDFYVILFDKQKNFENIDVFIDDQEIFTNQNIFDFPTIRIYFNKN